MKPASCCPGVATRLGVLLFLPLLVSCASTGVKGESDYDPTADFGSYKVFSWISERPLVASGSTPILNPLFETYLKRSTVSELRRKGYRFVADPSDADFVIAFTVGARDMLRIDSYPSYYRGRSRWGGAYYQNVSTTQYTEGQLAIDVFDIRKRTPVWHGWVTKRIRKSDIEDPSSAVDEVVAAVLANYPPQ